MSCRRPVETAATSRQGNESRLQEILQVSTNVSAPVNVSVPSNGTDVYHIIFQGEDITRQISDAHTMIRTFGEASDRLLSHIGSPYALEVTFHTGTAIQDILNKEKKTRVLTSYALSAVTWTPKLLPKTLSDRMRNAIDLLAIYITTLNTIRQTVNDIEVGFNHARVSAEVRNIWSSYRRHVINISNNVYMLSNVLEEASGDTQNPGMWTFLLNRAVSYALSQSPGNGGQDEGVSRLR